MMLIVCPNNEIQFYVTFHHFTNTITMKNLYEPTENVMAKLFTLLARTNKNCQKYLSSKMACVYSARDI